MNLTKASIRLAAGNISAVRSTNAKLAMAMSAVPGLDQAIQALDGLDQGVKTILPTLTFDDLEGDIRNSLAAGNGIPANTLERYAEAVAADQSWQVANGRLNDLYASLAYERDTLVQGSLSIICTALNDDLQVVFGKLAKLTPYPASADDAIAVGKVAQYQKATALRAEYFQIRAAQRLLLAHGLGPLDDVLFQHLTSGWPLIAHASGLGAIWPDLPEWHRYGRKLGKNGQTIKLTPPWPDPNTEAFLDWLLAHPDAGVWVPTFDQATDLLNQIVKSAQTLYETTRSPDQQALDEEYGRRKRMWSQPAHVLSR